MVRRRSRPAKDIAVLVTSNPGMEDTPDMLLNGEPVAIDRAATALTDSSLFDDQYFASPKRKDCRLMKAEESTKHNEVSTNNNNKCKANYPNGKATKSERAGSAGRTIGVPLATRSQTRTIEKFFRAKADAKYSNKATKQQLTAESDHTISLNAITTETTTESPLEAAAKVDLEFRGEELLYETRSSSSSSSPQYQYQSPLDEEDDDEDETQVEVQVVEQTASALHEVNISQFNGSSSVHSASFQTHRSALRDSHSSSHSSSTSSSAVTDNIFLQEPVLTLDIDRSPTKASSIKINKSFELASAVFSSPPSALSACMLNGRFNQIVTINEQGRSQAAPSFGAAKGAAYQQPFNGFELEAQHDSSSCDSGVACSLTTTTNTESPASAPARHRKPATPHRILCPSPIKTVPRDTLLLPATRKTSASAKCESLSPRKSPRKQTTAAAATAGKSRRRLNPPKPQAPYQPNTEANAAANDNLAVLLDDDVEDEDEDDVHALLKAAEETENLNKARTTMNNNNKTKIMLKPAAPKKAGAKGAKAKTSGGPKTQLPLVATNGNRELTEFFQVRRSVRKTKSVVKEENMRNLEQAVLEERADGLIVRHFEGKGLGVVTDRHFKRNEFVVEYVGDLIPISEAAERERKYALDENAGCYMYYFKHKNQQYCIDATEDTGKYGRLINHSRNGNLITKVVVIKQRPHLVLLAKDDIEPGVELSYDYGDRSKVSLMHHPWLAF